jgi:pyridoxal phosphate enzyme (YggS family)
MSVVAENLLRIQERVASAAARAGRASDDVRIVGVTKTQPAASIREAYAAGLRQFGENRVQEWEGKRRELADLAATWQLIGHLQSNKAARAAGLFASVDSVDDARLAERLDRALAGAGNGKVLRVLIEVRVAPEESKSGAELDAVPALAERVLAQARLRLAGLMCIPPYCDDPEDARPYFRRLRELRDSLVARMRVALPVLSMGMSHDFEVAIEEGATEIRVGTALFGARNARPAGL